MYYFILGYTTEDIEKVNVKEKSLELRLAGCLKTIKILQIEAKKKDECLEIMEKQLQKKDKIIELLHVSLYSSLYYPKFQKKENTVIEKPVTFSNSVINSAVKKKEQSLKDTIKKSKSTIAQNKSHIQR